MPLMTSLRTFRLASLSGYTVQFVASEPLNVPEEVVKEAMAQGCVPCDEAGVPSFDDGKRAKVDFQGDLRRSLIYAVIRSLVDENNIKNFDGAGMPKRAVVSNRLGFDVLQKELLEVYRTFTAARADKRELQLHDAVHSVLRVLDASSLAELVDLAEEFGDDRATYKGLLTRDVRKMLLQKFSGITTE